MIRPYRSRDLEQVLEVWQAASELAHPFLDPSFQERERWEIATTHLPAAETWVWEEDGRVAGFIALIGNEVGGLFVNPAHHRQGIGRALMDRARSARGSLEVSVFARNAVGRAFYEAYGFEVIGERLHERSGQPELRMRLRPARS